MFITTVPWHNNTQSPLLILIPYTQLRIPRIPRLNHNIEKENQFSSSEYKFYLAMNKISQASQIFDRTNQLFCPGSALSAAVVAIHYPIIRVELVAKIK